MKKQRKTDTTRRIFKGVLVLCLAVLILVAASHSPVGRWILDSREWFEGRPFLGAATYSLIFVGCAFLWFPTSVLMVGSGLLFGAVTGAAISSFSCVITASLCLVVVRYLAGKRVQEKFKKNRYFKTLCTLIESKGIFIISLLRISPLPFGPANCVYSVTPVRPVPYLFATWLGLIPANAAFSYLGSTGGALFLQGKGHSLGTVEITLMIAGAVALAIIVGFIGRKASKLLQSNPGR